MSEFHQCLLVLIFLAVSSSSQAQECPADFVSLGDSCYYFSCCASYWKDARNTCHEYGTGLVSIETQEEAALIRNYLIERDDGWRRDECNSHGLLDMLFLSDNDYWIGGYYDGTRDGYWLWEATGEPIDVFDWGRGSPDITRRKEYCLELEGREHFRWENERCNGDKERFICETEPTTIERFDEGIEETDDTQIESRTEVGSGAKKDTGREGHYSGKTVLILSIITSISLLALLVVITMHIQKALKNCETGRLHARVHIPHQPTENVPRYNCSSGSKIEGKPDSTENMNNVENSNLYAIRIVEKPTEQVYNEPDETLEKTKEEEHIYATLTLQTSKQTQEKSDNNGYLVPFC